MSIFRRRIIMAQVDIGNEWEDYVNTSMIKQDRNTVSGTIPNNLTDDIIAQFPYILYTSGAYYPRWICSTEPIFYVGGSWGSFYPVVNIAKTYVSNQQDNEELVLQKITDASWAMAFFTTQFTEHYYKNKNAYWNTSYLQIGDVPMYAWKE